MTTTTIGRAPVSTVAAIVLLSWTAWSTVQMARRVVAQRDTASSRDVVSMLADRFEQIKDAIPAGSTVGYATASQPRDSTFQLRHGVALYTLVPIIIERDDQRRVVIADFDSDSQLETYVALHRASLRRRFGAGLGIVERPEFAP